MVKAVACAVVENVFQDIHPGERDDLLLMNAGVILQIRDILTHRAEQLMRIVPNEDTPDEQPLYMSPVYHFVRDSRGHPHVSIDVVIRYKKLTRRFSTGPIKLP